MKKIKNMKIIVTIQCLLVLMVTVGLITELLLSIKFLFAFVIGESICLLYFYYCSIKPIETLSKELSRCIQDDTDCERILNTVSENTLFINKIKTLVTKCVDQKIRENVTKMFDKQAELTALQSQINPHFLCNTLESIRGQAIMDDNVEIARMVEALSSFFRYSISHKGNLVTLRGELANIKNYMTIQRYRFNNRFSLEIIIDDEDEKAYDYLIPKLILQPVVENAIYHGLEECLEGGKVIINITITEHIMILTVSDNGKGMDSKTLSDLNKRIHSANWDMNDDVKNTGIALQNINKRIQLLFGKEYGVNVYSTLSQGTDVEITIPANYERIQDGNEKRNASYS